jgi:hypothetical protein
VYNTVLIVILVLMIGLLDLTTIPFK